jgi:hypothetical protein
MQCAPRPWHDCSPGHKLEYVCARSYLRLAQNCLDLDRAALARWPWQQQWRSLVRLVASVVAAALNWLLYADPVMVQAMSDAVRWHAAETKKRSPQRSMKMYLYKTRWSQSSR